MHIWHPGRSSLVCGCKLVPGGTAEATDVQTGAGVGSYFYIKYEECLLSHAFIAQALRYPQAGPASLIKSKKATDFIGAECNK